MQSNNYWSSTSNANNTNNAWIVDMNNGNVNNNNKTNNNNYVWPVRAGEWVFPMFTFENLYAGYLACRRRKRATVNALRFEMRCEENLIALLEELNAGVWQPSRSVCFIVEKPKMREIVAADFRDRIVHHLLVERLEAIYEPVFVHDSYACRTGKGVHRAVLRVQEYLRQAGSNNREPLSFVHLDVRNFFMTIDKRLLFNMLHKKVRDRRLLSLAEKIIFHEPVKNCIIKGNPELVQYLPPHKSLFHAPEGKGLPVGNLTSQFFANVYLNELDQFVKHTLKHRFYVRYCDDFLLLDRDPEALAQAREHIRVFLAGRLALSLNGKYEAVLPAAAGMDFLGYIIRPHYTLARRRVVNTMKTKLAAFERKLVTHEPGMALLHYDYPTIEKLRAVLASYMGHLKWADTFNLRRRLLERYGFLHQLFSFEKGRIRPLYRFNEMLPRVRTQYCYYAWHFAPVPVFMRVGCFYEIHGKPTLATQALGLKRLGPNRRGATCGFPARLAGQYAAKLVHLGMSAVFIGETDRSMGRIKVRLPEFRVQGSVAGDQGRGEWHLPLYSDFAC